MHMQSVGHCPCPRVPAACNLPFSALILPQCALSAVIKKTANIIFFRLFYRWVPAGKRFRSFIQWQTGYNPFWGNSSVPCRPVITIPADCILSSVRYYGRERAGNDSWFHSVAVRISPFLGELHRTPTFNLLSDPSGLGGLIAPLGLR